MKCAICNIDIPDGQQVAVWDLPRIMFVCLKCSEKPEFEDITEEIMVKKD